MIFKKFFNKNSSLVNEFAESFNLLPSTMYLILSRGLSSKEEIESYLSMGALLDPFLIKGMKEFCERIQLARDLGDRVLIFGDYDVDGVSATAIMLKTLKKLGINADFYLPNRYVDGYGLTCESLDKVEKEFSPDLIITVDCGISCAKEVEYAKSKGIEIIVTDHHEIPEILPNTLILNAKIEGQDYPFRELCGTGMAYKMSEALLGQKKAEEFLPIAAIATIADIVSLTGENRNIVKRGLKMLEKLPFGVKMLFKENKVSLTNATSTDIAFKIAPKINSSGRMGDAKDSLALYMCEDAVTVRKYLDRIKKHNQKRQELSSKIFEDCEKAIQKMDLSKTRVICLASKKWDQGVLGIVCAKLVENYNRPVFLFSLSDDGILHGSGRSIDDINIHELLSSLQDILETFGGHTMAAGLTLKREHYEEFCNRVNAFAFEHVSDKVFIPIKYYDMEVKSEDLTDRFLKELSLLEPYGCDNARPKFKICAENVEITPRKYTPQHCDVKIGDLELIYFNYLKNYNGLKFSRYKNFIFEFQGSGKVGVVEDFDMGSFIVENAHSLIYPFQYQQLLFEGEGCKFSYYPKADLLNFVASTQSEVFGTAFVTYSAYDFVNFSREYSKENIYHIGICDKTCTGYNSLLLSPVGVEWAKNFSKIVFLLPVLDEGYLSEIQKVTKAEIFLPMEKAVDKQRYANLDLSRDAFGKVFRVLTSKQISRCNSIFDYYSKMKNKVGFDTFYVAYLVFKELGLIKELEADGLWIEAVQDVKKELTQSKLYNKLMLLKSTLGAK